MRLDWRGVCSATPERLEENRRYAESLGYPAIESTPKQYPVAVIGGGASIKEHIETLRNWPGDRWAVNLTFGWCKANNINATFVTSDAAVHDGTELPQFDPGDKILLNILCDKTIYDYVAECDVTTFRTGSDGIRTGATSATAAPYLSITMGYPGAVFFGCESSYGNTTHAYSYPTALPDMAMIEVGGEEYLTKPELIMQAQCLARLINEFPNQFSERSGGLLRAMCLHGGDYDVVAVSRSMLKSSPNVAEIISRLPIRRVEVR